MGEQITLTYKIGLLHADLLEVPPTHQKLAHTLFSAIQWTIVLNWYTTLLWILCVSLTAKREYWSAYLLIDRF